MSQAVYTQTNDSLIFVDFHAIVYAPGEPEIVYFACDHGVYRSADGGRTIERVNQGFNTLQFYRGVSISQKQRDFIAGVPQDYGVGFLRYSGAGPSHGLVDRSGLGTGGGVLGLRRRERHRLFHHSQQPPARTVAARMTTSRAIDPVGSWNPCYIPDVDPLRRSANCLDNTSWNAPLVLAPSNRNRLYAARDVVYRSDRAPDHDWAVPSAAERESRRKPAIRTTRPASPGRPPASAAIWTAIRSSPWRWRRNMTTTW